MAENKVSVPQVWTSFQLYLYLLHISLNGHMPIFLNIALNGHGWGVIKLVFGVSRGGSVL